MNQGNKPIKAGIAIAIKIDWGHNIAHVNIINSRIMETGLKTGGIYETYRYLVHILQALTNQLERKKILRYIGKSPTKNTYEIYKTMVR